MTDSVTATAELVVEHLKSTHDRKSFDCGVEALNSFLQKQARKEMERRSSVTYVLVGADRPTEIVGYYSLSSASVLLDSLPEDVLEKLGRQSSVPVTLMGRLAVRTSDQGTGVGGRLLWNALSRSESLSRAIGSVAVIVDAKDERAATYYQSHGLRPFAGQPSRLFITMATIAAART